MGAQDSIAVFDQVVGGHPLRRLDLADQVLVYEQRGAEISLRHALSEAEAPKICEALGVGCSIEVVGHFDPVTFDETLVSRVRAAAERLGYSHMNIISGAGHDACWTNRVAPSTMIMSPVLMRCVAG